MFNANANSQLFDELARLETQLATPVVPGEETAWLGAVREAIHSVNRALRPAIEQAHAAQFAEMREEDAVMAPRVESLKSDDKTNLTTSQELAERFRALEARYEVESNESLLNEQFENFVNDGLAFVVAVRKQETVVQTWFTHV